MLSTLVENCLQSDTSKEIVFFGFFFCFEKALLLNQDFFKLAIFFCL